MAVLKELDFNSFYFGKGVLKVVLKELDFNSFYFARMWQS